MEYAPDIIPVCEDCAQRSLLDEATRLCERCGVEFCLHFASAVDFKYCGNCMSGIGVTTSVEVKTIEYHNGPGGAVSSRRRMIAKSLKLTGQDFLFAQRQILDLTDEELYVAIEYHRCIASMMMLERETRKVEQYQKLQKIKVTAVRRVDVDATGAIKVPKVAKEKKIPKPKQNDILAAFATLLKAKGVDVSPEKIAEMMASMGVKK